MILAWWDVDIRIGAFHRRKVTARPLKDLERALGHRLHVEGWSRYKMMPPGVWKLEAFNYLDTKDAAVAMHATLAQLSRLSSKVAVGWSGYRRTAVDSDDVDQATIGALYWNPPDQFGLPRYVSSGVLLAFAGDEDLWCAGRQEQACRRARPIVQVPPSAHEATDYAAEFTVRIVCGNKRDVVEYHWPKFLAAHFPEGVDEVEIDNRTHAGKPNIIRVRQTLRGVGEHEAVTHCLAAAPYFRLQLTQGAAFRFSGELPEHHAYRDGISAFVLTRAPSPQPHDPQG